MSRRATGARGEADTTEACFCVYLADEIDVIADEWQAEDDHPPASAVGSSAKEQYKWDC